MTPSRMALRSGAWLTMLTVAASAAAYYRIFSGFAGWDDEGTLMMTVRQYLSGARLYEEIYTSYGPVYYFYNWLLRSATGSALDHNAVRITSAAVALLGSLICAWLVLRLTKSFAAASVAHLLVFRVFAFFNNEPGHPQELCMLLLAGLAGSGILAAKPKNLWLALAAAGSLAAALTLIKINIGIFAILAVALAVLLQSPAGWFWRAAKFAAAGGALLLPFALMRIHLDDSAAQAYCFVTTASIAGVLAAAPGLGRTAALSLWERLAGAAGFAATFFLVLLLLIWQGVPMAATLDMLVLENLRINVNQRFWYTAVELGMGWTAWALAGVIAAILAARAMRRGDTRVDALLGYFQAAFGGTGLLIGLSAPDFLLGFVTPFCWLLLFPRADAGTRGQTHARLLLCAAAVLQTLYAYPIAGSQTAFLRVLLVVVAAVALADGLHGLPQSSRPASLVQSFAQPVAAVTVAAVVLAYPLLGYRAKQLYASLTPLNLPGAERIHVEKQEAEDYQWLVLHLRQNCDTFVGLPGIPSLYFWTGKPLPGPAHPPGPLNFDNWMYAFSNTRQQAVVDELSLHPNACAVYHPSGVDSWNRGKLDVRGWPLANYILTQFKTVGRTGDYQFMIRNERHLEIPAGRLEAR